MARKTFKDRVEKIKEGAWLVNNELGEIMQLYRDMEEENIRLTEEVRLLRLQVARNRQTLAQHG